MWASIVSSWVLGAEELLLLEGGLRSWDAYLEATAIVAREGAVVITQSGSKRHPAAMVARDAFADYRSAIRQLGVEAGD